MIAGEVLWAGPVHSACVESRAMGSFGTLGERMSAQDQASDGLARPDHRVHLRLRQALAHEPRPGRQREPHHLRLHRHRSPGLLRQGSRRRRPRGLGHLLLRRLRPAQGLHGHGRDGGDPDPDHHPLHLHRPHPAQAGGHKDPRRRLRELEPHLPLRRVRKGVCRHLPGHHLSPEPTGPGPLRDGDHRSR